MLPSFLDHQHLYVFLVSMLRAGLWLLVLAVVFLPLERLFALHAKKALHKITAGDVGYYFLNSLLPGLLLAVPMSLAAWGAHRVVPYSFSVTVAAWPLWVRILAGLVVGEIGSYWGHRWSHEIPFLWRFHSIHHSAEHLYFLISARAHPLDNVFVKLCGLIPAYVLGVASPLTASGGAVSLLIVLVATMWGFFIHANLRWRLGPLEWIISTPAFHHWHHTLAQPRDRNYASMLPWIDRIFGTYYLPRNEMPSSYGIESKIPASMGGQLVYPLMPPPQAGLAPPVTADS